MSDQWRFVILSTTDWDAPQFGSRQQLALQFVRRGHQVLFVEVPRALHSFISDPAGTRRALARFGRVRQIPDGPMVYTPYPVLPIYYHPWTNAINQRLMGRYLASVVGRLGWQVDVLWTYWPNTAALAGRLNERLFAYHCIDNFSAVSYPFSSPAVISDMERRQCQLADIIFARTAGLAETRSAWNANTHFLPGGVDVIQFDPGRVTEPAISISQIPRPRVGFLGTLDNRIDLDLLIESASTHGDASFVLVGPVKKHRLELDRLRHQPNVTLLPACPPEEAPSVIAAFDVCLIPYRVNAYTRALSPIKLYEYLAMQKPVVATALPYVERERRHIALAENLDQFVTAIGEAVAKPPTPAAMSAWRDVAERNSWERQGEKIEALMSPLLEPSL